MKIVICGDWHLDLVVRGYDPHEDLLESIFKVVRATEGAGYFVHLGDTFETARPTPRAMATAIRALKLVADNCLVGLLRGNHDEVHRPPLVPDAIEPLRAVLDQRAFIPHVPATLSIGDRSLLFVPYLSDVRARSIGGKSAQQLVDDIFAKALAGELGEIAAAFTHLDVDGARAGTEGAVLRGGRLVMPAAAKVAPFPVYNGHIHREQTIGSIVNVGSVFPTDFSEVDGEKAFQVVEV